jgi:hypothetical protein
VGSICDYSIVYCLVTSKAAIAIAIAIVIAIAGQFTFGQFFRLRYAIQGVQLILSAVCKVARDSISKEGIQTQGRDPIGL